MINTLPRYTPADLRRMFAEKRAALIEQETRYRRQRGEPELIDVEFEPAVVMQ